ncbi:TIGR03086 family metal-binding protein [Actinomycetospora atypica]|uniref:TIGR03086 family metal-binding protein n=1 Tax=Actinomycetospora atypica TaxID=1290095 RepID=A0ABV9YJS3_9PSEU
MTDLSPADEYREIAGRFTGLVEGVPDDAAWRLPSPVPAWTARDVVGHLVGWFPAFLEGGTGISLPRGPAVEDDPVAAWRTMSDGVQALLDDPASVRRVLTNPYLGEVALPDAVSRFFTADVFMHTWDLARATGQDDTLDPQRCAVMLEGMLPLDEMLRASGQYGPRVPVSDDADVQTRLVAFIGRDPAFQAERAAPGGANLGT